MRISLSLILLSLILSTSINSIQAQSFTSSNLPILVINTNGLSIANEPKITSDFGVINNGVGKRNNLSDPFTDYIGKIGIEIRGSSSQMFPKKQYGIELRDLNGVGIAASLLGMPAEEDWILFAPYNDKSLMRDVLAYKLGRDMERWAPRTRYCELVLNGQYEGIYVLTEKIKRDKNRVNINSLNADEINGGDLTGGYIIKIDKESGNNNGGWFSDYPPLYRGGTQQIFFQFDYPEADDIAFEQVNYIKKYIKDFESTLISSTYNDPFNGYSKYIDVDSFVDFFIINEISKNPDGYRLSTFLHKQKDSDGGKLVMGPIWDFNLGFGNVNYCTMGETSGWVTEFNIICKNDYWLIPFWWDKLNGDPAFRNRLGARWQMLRSDKYSNTRINNYIDSVYNVLNTEAQQRNFQRWPVLGQYVWPNLFIGPTYVSEVNWLKNWINNRFNWLDANMPKVISSVDIELSDEFSIYPNPTEGIITIKKSFVGEHQPKVIITDPAGRNITGINVSAKDDAVEIDLSALPDGLYFYQILYDNQIVKSGKVVKLGNR